MKYKFTINALGGDSAPYFTVTIEEAQNFRDAEYQAGVIVKALNSMGAAQKYYYSGLVRTQNFGE